MKKTGWDGPYVYSIDDIAYDACGKRTSCEKSMKLFLQEWGNNDERGGTEAHPKEQIKRAILIDDELPKDQKIITHFQLEKIRNSKDLVKYGRLFSLAPASIKTAAIFIILQVLLDVIFRNEPSTKGSSPVYYGFACITLYLLGGILKGYNWSKWTLIALRGALPIIALYSLCGLKGAETTWLFSYYTNTFISTLETIVTSVPYMIALFMPTARQWFNGHVRDTEKLHRAVENDMKPMTFWKSLFLIMGLALLFGTIAIGRALLERM